MYIYMINLLPLRLIFVRTYERDSDKERLRDDVLPKFRAIKCCDFFYSFTLMIIPTTLNIYLILTPKLNKNFITVKM